MTPPDHHLEVNDTLRRLVIIFRILAWGWMITLVIITLVTDEGANVVVTVGAGVVATIWVGVTVWAARSAVLGTLVFVAVDGIVCLALGAASSIAGAVDFFHGGMPMSWIPVAAYGFGIWGAVPVSVVLAIEQVIVHDIEDKSLVSSTGSLVFVVFAVVIGWAFDELRKAERRREETELQLLEEQAATARHEERAELANRLHDSVVQSLLVIRRDADDAAQVRYLARKEERALRMAIADLRSAHGNSFRAALRRVCDEVEDRFSVEIEPQFGGADVEATDQVESAIGAAREALINAAKHSGVTRIDATADVRGSLLTIHVRDRGKGFDEESAKRGGGLEYSLIERMRAAGGSATVVSAPGQGTEVTITMDLAKETE